MRHRLPPSVWGVPELTPHSFTGAYRQTAPRALFLLRQAALDRIPALAEGRAVAACGSVWPRREALVANPAINTCGAIYPRFPLARTGVSLELHGGALVAGDGFHQVRVFLSHMEARRQRRTRRARLI